MLDALEAGDELEADEALLVPLDVLQQELVLGDVCVREVELNLVKHTMGIVLELGSKYFILSFKARRVSTTLIACLCKIAACEKLSTTVLFLQAPSEPHD